ncbi:FecR domain-containing protein [Parabacteroides sp. OttesenSCG-928-G06]|nr:FecR domain-containing protein [Parabacteroides sp. OttesenSCG-928-G06]
MKEKYITYKGYTSKELLDDDFFVQSMLDPTPESEVFWETLLEEGLLSPLEYEEACEFLQIVQKPRRAMSMRDRGALWAAIEVRNKENLRSGIRRRNIYLAGIAASLLILAGSYLLLRQIPREEAPDMLTLANEIKPEVIDPNSIQLIVSGEKTYQLEEHTAEIVLSEEGEIQVNSELLEEKPRTNSGQAETKFNQLIIPRGKHSRLTLSDGTTMHINSGSRVIFPEVFKSKEREIFVDGEIYLEVKQNLKSPFIVCTNKMRVEVLGTSFNISAYEEESEQSVVLVSGAVVIRTNDNRETRLLPNQKMTYANQVHKVTPVDVNQYISWKDGYLICNDEVFPSLMRKLSRYYGKTIECDPALSTYSGQGKLELKEDFEEVMHGLAEIFPIGITTQEDTCRIIQKK